MTYEQLDAIADAYIPVLAILTIVAVAIRGIKLGWWAALKTFAPFLLGTLAIYGVMFVDNALGFWPAFGLDYSTHTALALVFVCGLGMMQRAVMLAAITSMLAYCALMVYQQYHTLSDIVWTALIVTPILMLIHFSFAKWNRPQGRSNLYPTP